MPQISVIAPVYKVEPYLHHCVDSILAQTFTDFELILVDDGSPDNCGAICDDYAVKDCRIRVIHQENGGLSAARNAGLDWVLANSDSQWISFIDSDDWVHTQYLELLLDACIKNHTEISSCGIKKVEIEQVEDYPLISTNSDVLAPETLFTDRGRWIQAYSCGKLYRNNLWNDVRFPVGKNWEDTATTYKVLFAVKKVSCIEAELYYYYQNNAGIVKQAWTEKKLDHLWAIDQALQDPIIQEREDVVRLFLQQYAFTLVEQIQQIEESPLTVKAKQDNQRKLRKKLRYTLIRNGKRAEITLQKYYWYYETAFPKLAWLYWTFHGILGKVKRMVKK